MPAVNLRSVAALATILSASLALPAPVWAEPATTATHQESKQLCLSADTHINKMGAFCVRPNGNLLIGDVGGNWIKEVKPDDTLAARWKVGVDPVALGLAPDGTVFVGGGKKVIATDKSGKTLATATLKTDDITSITASDDDVFVACDSDQGYAVYRMTHKLTESRKVVEGLSGCCGQMDVCWANGALYVAENGRKRVVILDRDGKKLSAFTKDKNDDAIIDNFGSCCNPKNLSGAPDGAIYTSESDIGRVKRYSPSGKMLDYIGTFKSPPGCVRVTIGANQDGSKIYVADVDKNTIRVLTRKAQ